MKIFIDSANFEEIKEAVSWGVVDGATTNPTLIAKEKGQSVKVLSKKITQLVKGPVSLEGIAEKSDEIVAEAEELAKINTNVVVKVAITIEGIKAVKILSKKGIKTNVTLIFSANQALLAAKVGASYVSPFLGRLDDIGQTGVELIREIKTIFDNYRFRTEIIAASIRSPEHVKQAALAGCQIATVPFKVLKLMYSHALTDKGVVAFKKDWQTLKV